MNAVHYSSKTDLWSTPQWLFDRLNAEFRFDLDVCALPENAKCARYFTPMDDGLSLVWSAFCCWMNPPYGREIGKWVERAHLAVYGAEWTPRVVCLLPARVDTAWWWDYCTDGEIRFLKGRLKFGTAKNAAPFPSAVVIFDWDRPASVKWGV